MFFFADYGYGVNASVIVVVTACTPRPIFF